MSPTRKTGHARRVLAELALLTLVMLVICAGLFVAFTLGQHKVERYRTPPTTEMIR